jgi:adenylate kinase
VDGNPPKTDGTCDSCGGALSHRPDDREDVVAERLTVYRRLTEPVIEAYEGRGILRRIEGTGTPSEVFARIQEVVGRVSA